MSKEMHPPKPVVGENNKNRNIREMFKLSELGIFLSYKCNLTCTYCPHMSSYKKDQSKKLDLNILRDSIYEFVEKHSDPNIPIGVSVSGGEPTLNWNDFYELTHILNKIDAPLKGKQVTTNLLSELNRERLQFIVDNYDSIHVSIDGNKETQNLRLEDSFDKIMKNFMMLQAINNASKKRSFIEASITITIDNVKYLYDNIRFFRNNNIEITGGLDTTSQRGKSEEKLQEFAQEFVRQIKKTKKDFNWPEYSVTDLILQCDRNQAYYTANILPDGKIYRCPIVPLNPISSLDDNDIDYDNLNSFTEKGLSGDEYCNNCELKDVCRYCYAATGSNRSFYCGMLRAGHYLDKKYEKTGEY